jgi:hypothetical protein
MDQLKAELGLVQTNLANDSISLAEDHAAQAVELVSAVTGLESMNLSAPSSSNANTTQSISDIDAIIDEAITSRIDREQRDNATIQATALGDIITSYNIYSVIIIYK